MPSQKSQSIQDMKTLKKSFMGQMRLAMTAAMDLAADVVLDEMRKLTSLTDHSLSDLAGLGHPYAAQLPAGIPHEDYLVHIQNVTRGLNIKFRKTQVRATRNLVRVNLHNDSDHLWYVVLGTRYMRPRDFVSAALINKTDEVGRIVESAYNQVIDQYRGERFRPRRVILQGHTQTPQLPEER